MRDKKAILALDAKKTNIKYPTPVDFGFDRFRMDLRRVLVGNDIPGEWEWDDNTRTWGATWTQDLYPFDRPGVSARFAVTFTCGASLDPEKPLLDEVERLIRDHAKFVSDCKLFVREGCRAFVTKDGAAC